MTETLSLDEVLCVPLFSFNFISARRLAQRSKCCLIFSPESCFVKDLLTRKKIGMANVRQGLYHLLQEVSPPALIEYLPVFANKTTILASVITKSKDFDLWHYRLGHPSDSRISLLSLDHVCIPTSTKKPCSICPLAKYVA